jgi:hypothetical protein
MGSKSARHCLWWFVETGETLSPATRTPRWYQVTMQGRRAPMTNHQFKPFTTFPSLEAQVKKAERKKLLEEVEKLRREHYKRFRDKQKEALKQESLLKRYSLRKRVMHSSCRLFFIVRPRSSNT